MIRDAIIRMGMKVPGANAWTTVHVAGNFDWALNTFETTELSDHATVYSQRDTNRFGVVIKKDVAIVFKDNWWTYPQNGALIICYSTNVENKMWRYLP